MCGIAGIVRLSDRLEPQKLGELAHRMAEALRHRGPDDSGVWIDPTGTCALSQRRLSILDLSPAGHQPMIHPETGMGLTFNGEIYNFQTLRTELETQGIIFRGHSDTEILLHGLVRHGQGYLNRLDGMFAFATFDPQTKRLFMARDIFGEKPLYYAQTPDWFAFSSELHALTLLPGFAPRITIDRLATFMALQYLPAPQTIYLSASKLPPGHKLTLQPDGRIEIEHFFEFRTTGEQTGTRTLDNLADELEALIAQSVQTRQIADVPLGAFLSGGVDSSTIAAFAMRGRHAPLQSFSIGFEGHADSEHEEARAMAAHLGTDHRDQVLKLDALDLGQHIAGILDEPNGDTSCLPTWMLSRMARQHVTVALSGDGGDELFGGYARYQRQLQDQATASSGWSAGATYYSPRILVFGDQAIEKFLGAIPPETTAVLAQLRAPIDETGKPLLHRLRETDITNYMPGAVLAKVDRMSMQHALEVRAPFLSRDIATFAMNLPSDVLCTPDQSKRLLKHLAARYIPREWLDRPKKGFGLPIQGWGGADLTNAVEDLLASPECKLLAWIPRERLGRFMAFHRNTPITYQLWEIFILEHWLRTHPCEVA